MSGRSPLRALVALSALAAPAPAQVPLPSRLDLEPAGTTGDLPAGYAHVPPAQTFSAGSYGWDVATTGYSHVPAGAVLVQLGAADAAEHQARTKLLRDGHVFGGAAAESRAFSVDLGGSEQAVRVRVTLGTLEDYLVHQAPPTTRGMKVGINGQTSGHALVTREVDPLDANLQGAWARTLEGKANLETRYGGYRSLWFRTFTDASGVLSIGFASADGYRTAVSGIEVYALTSEPIEFLAGSMPALHVVPAYAAGMSGPEAASLASGVAKLNAGDVAGAEADFRAIVADDLARAAGLLWCAGWLGGTELGEDEGREWTLVLEAIGELEGLIGQPGFVSRDVAAEYLDRALEYRRAYKHWRLRGYLEGIQFTGEGAVTPNPYAGDGYSLLKNLNIAEAMWRNVGAQQVHAADANPHVAIHPLFFRAQLFLGANWFSRSAPNNWNSSSPPALGLKAFNTQHFSLWKEFDAKGYLAVFPDCDELAVAAHCASYDGPDPGSLPDYDEEVSGGIHVHWGGEKPANPLAWWTGLLAEAASIVPSGPDPLDDWAAQQWRSRQALIAGHTWWNESRYQDTEFGGGGGDDVEFILLEFGPAFPVRRNETAIEAVAREVVDANLEPYGATGTGQYFFGDGSVDAADVEHTGEYTGNPLWIALQFFWGEPEYLEYAMRSVAHMTGPTPAAAWTELVPWLVSSHTYPGAGGVQQGVGVRRFRAWHLDAEGPDLSAPLFGGGTIDTSGDVSLNGRAVMPAYYLNAYNQSPEPSRWMREWAEWWWIVAMDDGTLTAGGSGQAKPRGVLPAVVDVAGGANQLVYGDPDLPSQNWWQGAYGFKEGALVYSYFVYSGLFLQRYLDPATPAAQRTDYLLPIWESSRLVAELWREQHHPSDPPLVALGGSSAEGSLRWTANQQRYAPVYMREVLIAWPHLASDMGIAALPGATEQLQYLREILVAEGDPYAPILLDEPSLTVVEQKRRVNEACARGFDWLDGFFPLGTDLVAYTDRAFLFQGTSLYAAFNSSTGGFAGALPAYAVTWERPRDVYGAPVEPELAITALVKGVDHSGPGPKLTALLSNHEVGTGTRDLDLRFWYGLPPGQYQLAYGPNSGADTIASVVYTSATFTVERPGSAIRIPVPYAASASSPAEVVIEIVQQASLPAPGGFADIGIGHGDLAVRTIGGTTTIYATFHSVGNQPVVAAPVLVWAQLDQGTPFILTAPNQTVSLGAPNDLVPKKQTFTRSFGFVPPPGSVLRVGALANLGTSDGHAVNDQALRVFEY